MGARAMTPKPPPGFEIIPTQQAAVPPPPPGFEIVTKQPRFSIDWNADDATVRAQVSKLPETDRQAALDEWAQARVARDGVPGGKATRLFNKGLPIIGGFLDEAVAGLRAIGTDATYDEALALERARDKAAADEYGGAGGTALAVAGGLASAPFTPIARGAGVLSDIGLGIAQGAGYGAVAGFANSEGGAGNRLAGAGAGGVVGGVTGGALTAGARGVQGVRRAYANQGRDGAYGSVAGDLPGTVDEFADQVATGATRGNPQINRRTLDILGEEMERAGGNVQQAQQAAIARIATEYNVTPQTAAGQIRRLTRVHEDSPLMLAEYPSVAASNNAQRMRTPGNTNLDELGRLESTGLQGKLDYLANNGNAQSAANTRNALSLRQETLAPSMRETFEGMAPQLGTGRPATIADTGDLVETARRLANQEYTAAYNSPVATPQRYQQLPRFFEYLSNRAATSAPEVAAVIRNAVNQVAVRRPDGSIGVQGLRQLQQGRTTIRGQMQALVQSGRADLANEIRPFYQLLTRVMEEMSPQWAVANRRWADMNLAQVAQELGDAFSTKAGPRFREQLAEFRALAPEAQDIVRVHVLQKELDKLDNLGDTHSISKLYSNDASRNLIRELFGDEAVVRFTRAVRDQKVAEVSQNMTKNSATHRRGIAQKQADAETGLVSAMENANARGVRNWLAERLTQLLTERRNRPMADILTTPLSDTARVSQHIYNMRRQQERLQQFDQPPRGRAPAVGGSLTGGAMGVEDNGSDITGSAGLDAIGGGAEGDRLQADPYDQIPITADGNEEAARAAQARMYADNRQRLQDRSLVTYGDQQVIPNNIDDAVDMLVSGAAKAGDVLAAFPGVGTLIDDLGNAAGAGLKALRNAPKAPQEIIPGASKEGDAILAAQRAAREKEQAAARAAREEADRKARGAAYQAEAAKRGSTGTVPALSPAKDRAAIVEGLPEGTAPMAIKGRQGMPTRDEQIELVDKYISGGGRVRDLPSGDGPWGSSPQRKAERAQEAIQRAFDKDKAKQPPAKAATVGDEANLPSVKELMEAWKGAKAEADRLRSEIKSLKEKGRDTARLSEELRQTQLDLVRLQQASGYRRRFRTASEVLDGLPPQYVPIEPPLSVPPREAPRIYRKGQ